MDENEGAKCQLNPGYGQLTRLALLFLVWLMQPKGRCQAAATASLFLVAILHCVCIGAISRSPSVTAGDLFEKKEACAIDEMHSVHARRQKYRTSMWGTRIDPLLPAAFSSTDNRTSPASTSAVYDVMHS